MAAVLNALLRSKNHPRADTNPPPRPEAAHVDTLAASASDRRRKKTLPFPLSRESGDGIPFLVELDRETTWRFIAPATESPAPFVDDAEYEVEVTH